MEVNNKEHAKKLVKEDPNKALDVAKTVLAQAKELRESARDLKQAAEEKKSLALAIYEELDAKNSALIYDEEKGEMVWTSLDDLISQRKSSKPKTESKNSKEKPAN